MSSWDVVVNDGSGLRVWWTSVSEERALRYAHVVSICHPQYLVDVLPKEE